LLVFTEPFVNKVALEENMFGAFAFVGRADRLIPGAKSRLNKVKSLHSIGTKANTGTET
jgi:hypothetical protein